MEEVGANQQLCGRDRTFWQDKEVVVVQHNAAFDSHGPAHPLSLLHSLGAHVTVIARPSASTLETLRTHEAVDHVLLLTHTGIWQTLLECLRIKRHDVALLYLPYKTFEKYIPHIGCFMFLRARKKMILVQRGHSTEEYTVGRFFFACVRRIWPYAIIVASIPYVTLRNWLRQKRIDPSAVRRILLVRLDHIGDVIMATPLLDMLHQQFPHAEIDMLLGPWVAGLFEHDPRIRNVFRFAAPWHDRATPPKDPAIFLREARQIFKKLQTQKYDIALDSRGNFLDSWVAYKSGAPVVAGTVGFFYNMAVISNAPFLTHQALYGETLHYAGEQHRALAQTLSDLPVPMSSTHLFIPQNALQKAESFLPATHSGNILISLHVNCGDASRQWPSSKFALLLQHLFGRYGNTLWIFLVGSEEKENQTIMRDLQERGITNVVNVGGKLSLVETAALMSKMTLHIGNDSGPMHIADAVQTPVVALFIRMFARVHAPIRPHHEIVLTHDDTSPIATIDEELVYGAVCKVITARQLSR